jgi:hypothetical protein
VSVDETKVFSEIKEYAAKVKGDYSERDTMAVQIENMYLMNETAEDAALKAVSPSVALTKSTDERVAVKGIVRLLASAEEQISMPRAENTGTDDVADMIEQGAQALLASSDRANQRPLRYDVVLAKTLHDMCSIRVTCTKDMLDFITEGDKERKKGGGQGMSAGRKARIERMVKSSPYIFEALNPRTCYPVWDRYGLQSHLTITQVRLKDIIEQYGAKAQAMFAAKGKSVIEDGLKPIDLWDYLDDTYRATWCEDGWLVMEEHKMPFMNIVSSRGEGSSMFAKTGDQFEPFLMTVLKSGFDRRTTEALTAFYTNMRIQGFSPKVKHMKGPENNSIEPPQQVGMWQVWEVEYGADIQFMASNAMPDASGWAGLDLAFQKKQDSTIYNNTLGAGAGNNDPYSKTALMSQLGRIPLEITRAMSGRLIADALEVALLWIKKNGEKVGAYDYRKGALANIDPAKIPEYFNLSVNLDVSLAQDQLVMAQIAAQLKQAGLVSDAWIQEEIMNIGQPKQMARDIMKEQARGALGAIALQNMVQQKQMQQQAMMPPQQPMPQEQQMPLEPEQPFAGSPFMPRQMQDGGMQGPQDMGMPGQVPEGGGLISV